MICLIINFSELNLQVITLKTCFLQIMNYTKGKLHGLHKIMGGMNERAG